ncbi:MAG: aminotransferase class I/II-fold pyridoxal phosphate-dependent enzyme, partial [Pseudomonadota bacterium]
SLIPTSRRGAGRTDRGGDELISFCDNDYLGLATDPRVIAAAQAAAIQWGVGAGASRLVTGDHPLNETVEAKLAEMKGTEGARLFGSGYLANIGTIPVLVGRNDRIIMDDTSHACMHAGAQLSGAQIILFKHNNAEHLRAHLQVPHAGRTLVLTETVFSMDGDLAPLEDISALCQQFGAWLMTDDAHGLGIINQNNPADIQMGTLSKAAGSYGGYVCGPKPVMELLTNRARSLIFTTGLPPTVLAATLEALSIIEAEPERGARALELARLFCDLMGLDRPDSTIVPVILGEERAALQASEYLKRDGFLVAAIRPPTVAEGTSRLRITFSATHEETSVRALAASLMDARAIA